MASNRCGVDDLLSVYDRSDDFEQRPPNPVDADATYPVPLNALQAVKWNIADLLHRHTAMYVVARAGFRMARFVLRPVRAGYRAVRGLFDGAVPNDR